MRWINPREAEKTVQLESLISTYAVFNVRVYKPNCVISQEALEDNEHKWSYVYSFKSTYTAADARIRCAG